MSPITIKMKDKIELIEDSLSDVVWFKDATNNKINKMHGIIINFDIWNRITVLYFKFRIKNIWDIDSVNENNQISDLLILKLG